MKARVIIFISLIGLATLSGCTKDDVTICRTLSKQGSTGLSSLIGEWNFESFAYTRNGKKIQNEEILQDKNNRYMNVTDTGAILMYHQHDCRYKYWTNNLKSNGIAIGEKVKLGKNGSSIYTFEYSLEEEKIWYALEYAQCYTIKGNRLYIHYTEKDGMNVLILTKG